MERTNIIITEKIKLRRCRPGYFIYENSSGAASFQILREISESNTHFKTKSKINGRRKRKEI